MTNLEIAETWTRKVAMGVLFPDEWCDNYVHLECIGARLSHPLMVETDDKIVGRFYSRDYTSSGLPFVDDNEIYWSGYWFEFRHDAEFFMKSIAADYKPVGVWEPNYPEEINTRNKKRGKCE
jgi:hypothetical protein